jgi:ferredoxin
LTEAAEDERDLVGRLPDRAENSRLACQLEVRPELDGIVVRVAGTTGTARAS